MRDVLLADFRAAWDQNASRYLEAVSRVGASGWLVLGKEVEAFEAELSAFWRLPHAIGVANGLDALEISFRALGARPGDRYLTTPLSAFATTLAILRAGGIPEFVDVDPSGLIDLRQVRARLADKTLPAIRFLVPVHLFGHAASLAELAKLKQDFKIEVVEDCAQSIGATSGGRPVGAESLLAATSFYPTKNLGAFGDGGAVIARTAEHAQQVRALRDYGQSRKYVHSVLGLNSRLDELQAALLREQLKLLPAQTTRRQELAHRYLASIKNERLHVPPIPPDSGSVWHLFPLLVDGDRGTFQAHLKAQGVQTAVHYPMLIPAQDALTSAGLSRLTQEFPVAQRYAAHEVSIPMHPYLSDDDCDRVITACNSWNP